MHQLRGSKPKHTCCDNVFLYFGGAACDGDGAVKKILSSGCGGVRHWLADHLVYLGRVHQSAMVTIDWVGTSLDECIDDYRKNLLYPVFVVVTASTSVDLDARGEKLFPSMFNRSCEAIRDANALELIESL